MQPGRDFAGIDVVLSRTPDQAVPMARELAARGATVRLMPLIDFELPGSTDELKNALGRLARGSFAWMVFTSATTVRALERTAQELGLPRLAALVPAGTKVAAVGTGTARALHGCGLETALLPQQDQSARGLAALWPAGPGLAGAQAAGTAGVLLPQADIADPFLRRSLAAAGWDVSAVTAYRTVDYPAQPARGLGGVQGEAAAGLPAASGTPDEPVWPLISPEQFAAAAPGSRGRAVVLTSPSTARAFAHRCRPLPPGLLLIAIGDPTAAQLTELDLPPSAVAGHPTPEGIADALAAALPARP